MTAKDYITPTKERPVFQIWNTYTGYVVTDISYKEWRIKNDNCNIGGETSATTLPDAMETLFKHIEQNPDYTKSSFTIEMIDGSVNKYGEPNRVKCYSISMKQAKKFNLI